MVDRSLSKTSLNLSAHAPTAESVVKTTQFAQQPQSGILSKEFIYESGLGENRYLVGIDYAVHESAAISKIFAAQLKKQTFEATQIGSENLKMFTESNCVGSINEFLPKSWMASKNYLGQKWSLMEKLPILSANIAQAYQPVLEEARFVESRKIR